MALSKHLTKGRRQSLNVAACVYMACRSEKTGHLLIDFCDVAQVDVYTLGRAYTQIYRALSIKFPVMDPCLYIIRFAHEFNLGSKTNAVAMTASRLVERMKKDWIHLGRQPSGLCGAALLIAARLHKFSRTVNDVVKIVKVHQTTLKRRLNEFSATKTSRLTFDDFNSVDLEEEHDPPSFEAARARDREELQKILKGEGRQEFTDLHEQIEKELTKKQRKTAKVTEEPQEVEDTTKFIVESTVNSITEMMDLDESIETENDDTIEWELDHEKVSPDHHGPSKPDLADAKVFLEKTIHEIDRLLMPPPSTSSEILQHTTTSAGEPESDIPLDGEDPVPIEQIVDEEDLSEGIDDAEIERYIMSPAEVEIKAVLWEKINAEYLKEQELRSKDKENKPVRKKKKVKAAVGEEEKLFQAKNANEAIRIMIKEKNFSKKIDYDILKTLDHFDTIPSASLIALPAPVQPRQTKVEMKPSVTVIGSGSIVSPRNMKRDLDEKLPDSTSIKPSKKPKVKIETSTASNGGQHHKISARKCKVKLPKNLKFQTTHTTLAETVEEIAESVDEIVLDSKPVQAVQFDDYQEEEEEMSAQQLLSQFRGGDDDDNYYDFD